tara:strand:+ start:1094 stop:1315 length:222 start_codon:yes stop_codon:yes gene_type:complete
MTSFVLVGTILSFDSFLATVEFQTNPPVNGGPSVAVLPVEAIPCDAEVGKKLYVVKYEEQETPTISCEKQEKQ